MAKNYNQTLRALYDTMVGEREVLKELITAAQFRSFDAFHADKTDTSNNLLLPEQHVPKFMINLEKLNLSSNSRTNTDIASSKESNKIDPNIHSLVEELLKELRGVHKVKNILKLQQRILGEVSLRLAYEPKLDTWSTNNKLKYGIGVTLGMAVAAAFISGMVGLITFDVLTIGVMVITALVAGVVISNSTAAPGFNSIVEIVNRQKLESAKGVNFNPILKELTLQELSKNNFKTIAVSEEEKNDDDLASRDTNLEEPQEQQINKLSKHVDAQKDSYMIMEESEEPSRVVAYAIAIACVAQGMQVGGKGI
jgi:hypothetical protein